MRPTRPVALSCVVLCGVLAGPGWAAKVSALEILNKTYDPLTQQLEFELRNRSEKAITAWRLSLARSDSQGHGRHSLCRDMQILLDVMLAGLRIGNDVISTTRTSTDQCIVKPCFGTSIVLWH